MKVSTTELATARDAAADILAELGLEAYLFDVKYGDDCWRVYVECAMDSATEWESVTVEAPKAMLLAAFSDRAVHRQLLEAWGDRLAVCRRRPDA